MSPISFSPLVVEGCTTYKQPHRQTSTEGLNIEVICRPITSTVSDSFPCAPQGFVYPEKSRGKTVFYEPNSTVQNGNVYE